MNGIDSRWVKYCSDRGKFLKIIDEIASSARLFARFLFNLKSKIESRKLEDADVFCALVSDALFQKAAAGAPLSAFGYAVAALMLANHRGDTTAGQSAADKADRLFQTAVTGDVNLCAEFLNCRFVSFHNQYRFSPAFPDALRQMLKMLEARRRCQYEFGCPTDAVLARLYGTIAQNFGFCGPKHLPDTETYARMAMDAFGSGSIPEYLEDALRQHSYLTYAYLDAGNHPKAYANLLAFLGVTNWKGIEKLRIENRLSVWHHAALARFLADAAGPGGCPEQKTQYLDWCARDQHVFSDREHPRQLWTFNHGANRLGVKPPGCGNFLVSAESGTVSGKRKPAHHLRDGAASGLRAFETGPNGCILQ